MSMNMRKYYIQFTISTIIFLGLGLFIDNKFPVIIIFGQEMNTIDVVFPSIVFIVFVIIIRRFIRLKRR